MNTLAKPALRPARPEFSSGPCAKRPGWTPENLKSAVLGRAHRSKIGKARLQEAINRTRSVLQVPDDFLIGIVPGSDTGAVEMAMWSMLGPRPVQLLAFESFGKDWVTDVTKQLKIPAEVLDAPYGRLPDLSKVRKDADLVFTWNGTTSGVRLPVGTRLPAGRAGLTICDATSAAFGMALPWEDLDVATFSWQKCLGGEGAHGMLVLGPRAMERLQGWTPPWPIPKLFRLAKGGRVPEGLFAGETINTPSMLALEDWLAALGWAEAVGGLPALIARADANAAEVAAYVARNPWLANLAQDPATASSTSVCLRFADPEVAGDAAFAAGVAKRLEKAGVAFDVGSYRDAPPGLRIWCGPTVERADVAALMPWIGWAYGAERAARPAAA